MYGQERPKLFLSLRVHRSTAQLHPGSHIVLFTAIFNLHYSGHLFYSTGTNDRDTNSRDENKQPRKRMKFLISPPHWWQHYSQNRGVNETSSHNNRLGLPSNRDFGDSPPLWDTPKLHVKNSWRVSVIITSSRRFCEDTMEQKNRLLQLEGTYKNHPVQLPLAVRFIVFDSGPTKSWSMLLRALSKWLSTTSLARPFQCLTPPL